MKFGSHNTMTYLNPEKWYMYPFRFIAQCQSKTIEEQYKSGARWFDIRIGFNKKCNPVFKHGLMAFKGDVENTLDFLTSKDDVIIRLLSEDSHPFFYDYCKYLEEKYGNKFCGGKRKSDWKQVYKFKYNPHYTIEENYSSMPSNPRLYSIWPWLYAKLHKKRNTDKDYLLIDFI